MITNASQAKFAVFSFSAAISHASSYNTVTVAYVAGSAAFTNGEAIYVNVVRTGDRGTPGGTGSTGPAGAPSAGVQPYNFDTSTTNSDPGSGKLRLNNAAPGSATAMYVDDLTNVAVDVSAYILALGNSTSPIKGFVELSNSDKSKVRIYSLTAVITHASSYCTLTLTYLTGTGTFTNGEAVFLGITRIGDTPIRVTQAEYAAFSPPDPNVWYVVTP